MSKARKAVGTAIVGVYAWWGAVVISASGPITAAEWYTLGGVGVAVAAVYGLTNAPVEAEKP